MAQDQTTLRDMVVSRLTLELGQPQVVGEGYYWTVKPNLDDPPVSVSLNSWLTGELVRLWVFDRRKPGAANVRRFEVAEPGHIEPVVQSIRHIIDS